MIYEIGHYHRPGNCLTDLARIQDVRTAQLFPMRLLRHIFQMQYRTSTGAESAMDVLASGSQNSRVRIQTPKGDVDIAYRKTRSCSIKIVPGEPTRWSIRDLQLSL